MPRLRVPLCGKANWLGAWRLCRSVVLPHETMEPVLDAFTNSHPPRGRPERLAVITGSFQIFPDRRWASLRLGTNARLPPKWHVCLSVCSLRCARRLPRATSTKVRHVPGVDDASVPCPLISRCEKHSAHICCRHAFLPPSSLLPPFSGACLLSRTDFFEGTGERAWSWLLATLCGLYTHTCTCHVMSNS